MEAIRENGKDKTRGGGVFLYLNNTHFDLYRMGVHDEIKKENYNETCLYLAFKYGGMEEHKLERLKTFINNRIVPKCKLKDVCEYLEITTKLSTPKNSLETRIEHYGKKRINRKL